ncbi:MAG: CBS domain-containing protein [Methanobacterium sp.]|uniref:CBS domain-containing protein n=1 Tax=Methanobacterium sp. TaxID=2164 RepID=UPI003D661D1A|nr:CBS domain-containing protein [Methanobacterium sp.]
MKSSIKIFSIFGIPVELHISFLLLIILIFSMAFFGFISFYIAFLIILLFSTVIIHELSHSYMAKRYGIPVDRIILLPIGGIASMGKIPKDPNQELKIAIAGPSANIIIALFCFICLGIIGGLGSLSFSSLFITNTPSADLTLFLSNFLGVNLLLGIFNLLPAFPMDGGRVLRAFLARKMDYVKATKIAASVGIQFAVLIAILGIFFNIFLILIAIFIYIGADQEYKATLISSMLEGIYVKDIMAKNVDTLSPETPVFEALSTMFKQRHMGYPVMDNENLIGIVTFEDISKLPEERHTVPIKNIMTKNLILASPDEPALSALEKIQKNNIGRLPVTRNGKLIGIVSKTDIIRVLDSKSV